MDEQYSAQAESGAGDYPPPPPRTRASTHSPGRAALCALVPGLGAVYNRQYQKAVVHFAVFAALARMGDANGIFIMAALAFYLFMMIDAYRSAEVIRLRGPDAVLLDESDEEMRHLPLWGGFLVLIGVLFLLDNMDLIRLNQLLDFWPLLFIVVGGYLLYQAFTANGSSDGRRSASSRPSGGSSLFSDDPGSVQTTADQEEQ